METTDRDVEKTFKEVFKSPTIDRADSAERSFPDVCNHFGKRVRI